MQESYGVGVFYTKGIQILMIWAADPRTQFYTTPMHEVFFLYRRRLSHESDVRGL